MVKLRLNTVKEKLKLVVALKYWLNLNQMNARSYKIILAVLSFCIFFILLIQAYWIRNSYLRKKEDFNRVVYESLGQLSDKLQERRGLRQLKMTYFIQNGDTIAKTPSRHMRIVSENNIQLNNRSTQTILTKNTGSVILGQPKDSIIVTGKDKQVNLILSGTRSQVFVNDDKKDLKELIKKSGKNLPDEEELTKLVDKMVTEITVMDTNDDDPDTLKKLIQKTLENKGLFIPFEFSMQKKKGAATETLLQSKGYRVGAPSYKSDLSANKVFNTHDFLVLQFPSQNDFILAGIKGSLILSFVFSLVIISAFYYTLRLIFKQKRLSEIKNDFVNNMTHELKTPIATISLALDAIKNPIIKNDEEKFNDYNRILKEENQKLNKHVERVLQMALLEKGELALYKKQVDLVAVAQATLDHYKLQIAGKTAVVEVSTSSAQMFMQADEQHLQTVFGNLLDNALKYSGADCRIFIQVQQEQEGIKITFRDNGIGIDEHQQTKIFEKFYRAQAGNVHDVKGFGLGLSYVKSIVEAHGGTITVQSEKGKGSEFVIRFK